MSHYPDRPYVYHLVDPRSGWTFYVGKGRGARRHQHMRDVRAERDREYNPFKVRVIADIHCAGYEVWARIVREFDTDKEAFTFEACEIARLGLENLTNRSPGHLDVRMPLAHALKYDTERGLLRIDVLRQTAWWVYSTLALAAEVPDAELMAEASQVRAALEGFMALRRHFGAHLFGYLLGEGAPKDACA